MPAFDDLATYLVNTLSKIRFTDISTEKFTNVGSGGVFVALSAKGSAVLVWDGKEHVDVNLFNFNDRQEMADAFASTFIQFSEETLLLALRDDYPRGTGRVVNFKRDSVDDEDAPAEAPKPRPLKFE